MLVGDHLSAKEEQPDCSQADVEQVDLQVAAKVDGIREHVNQHNLVVRNEEEVQQFHEDLWVVVSDVDPPVVLSSPPISALPVKVVG